MYNGDRVALRLFKGCSIQTSDYLEKLSDLKINSDRARGVKRVYKTVNMGCRDVMSEIKPTPVRKDEPATSYLTIIAIVSPNQNVSDKSGGPILRVATMTCLI